MDLSGRAIWAKLLDTPVSGCESLLCGRDARKADFAVFSLAGGILAPPRWRVL